MRCSPGTENTQGDAEEAKSTFFTILQAILLESN
jgi:hypothetical protein